eukprot:358300-Chlamydomonas_euryale.AAC.2
MSLPHLILSTPVEQCERHAQRLCIQSTLPLVLFDPRSKRHVPLRTLCNRSDTVQPDEVRRDENQQMGEKPYTLYPIPYTLNPKP